MESVANSISPGNTQLLTTEIDPIVYNDLVTSLKERRSVKKQMKFKSYGRGKPIKKKAPPFLPKTEHDGTNYIVNIAARRMYESNVQNMIGMEWDQLWQFCISNLHMYNASQVIYSLSRNGKLFIVKTRNFRKKILWRNDLLIYKLHGYGVENNSYDSSITSDIAINDEMMTTDSEENGDDYDDDYDDDYYKEEERYYNYHSGW